MHKTLLEAVFCGCFLTFIPSLRALAADAPSSYTPIPDHWYRGETFDVTVSDDGCKAKPPQKGTLTSDVAPALPEGSGAKMNEFHRVGTDNCDLVMSVKVDPEARLGELDLRLEQGGQISKLVPVIVADKPEVDVKWSVISPSIIVDNFGFTVNKRYYGIDLSIGKASGYDLQISGVGFTPCMNPAPPNAPCPMDKQTFDVPLPSSSYTLARGTILHAQQVGVRAILLSVIGAVGTIGTGFIPFFKAVTPKANFSTGVALFGNPLTTGVGAVIPDTLPNHLTRLDDQYLKEGTVVHDKDEARYRVFFPKQLVKDLISKVNVTATPKLKDDNLVDVERVLGEMVIVGKPITYGPRIRLVTPAAAASPTPTPPSAIGSQPAPPGG